MAVSIEQLEAFIATHKFGSFSEAGRKTKKAQSVISTLVSNLELDLGLELFDRSKRYPVLTREGESLLGRANSIVEQRNKFILAAQELLAGAESKLVIAIENQISINNLGSVLKKIVEVFPFVDIEIDYGTVQDVWQRITEGVVQLGIVAQPEKPLDHVDFKGVGHLEMLCVASAGHPLAKVDSVSWDDLKQYRQVLIKGFEDTSISRLQVSFQYWQAVNAEDALEMVTSGIGWAGLPSHLVSQGIQEKKLKQLCLDFDNESIVQQVDLIWSNTAPLQPVAKYIVEYLYSSIEIKNA